MKAWNQTARAVRQMESRALDQGNHTPTWNHWFKHRSQGRARFPGAGQVTTPTCTQAQDSTQEINYPGPDAALRRKWKSGTLLRGVTSRPGGQKQTAQNWAKQVKLQLGSQARGPSPVGGSAMVRVAALPLPLEVGGLEAGHALESSPPQSSVL